MKTADVIIIGAGLLGCFAARALSAWNLDITVLEQREDVCTGISRANTGVIYTGYDTKPGTLKTTLCVRANAGFEKLCNDLSVPFHRCGSIMVSTSSRADMVLRKKYEQGCENKVPGLQLLDRNAVLEREPELSENVHGGLYAPGTGTVHPWALCIAAYENARQNGVEFCFNKKVLHMERTRGGFWLETPTERYWARAVLNCAGLSAGKIRELTETPEVRLIPTAGDYLVLDDTAGQFLKHVVFYEPEEKGKGVTFVPTVDGNVLIGATERPWNGVVDYATDRTGLLTLHELTRQLFPHMPLDQVIRSFGTLRPNPYYVHSSGAQYVPEEKSISSFITLEENGLFSLIGIKTPGLTCAAELGDLMAKKITAYLHCDEMNPVYSPHREKPPAVRDMPVEVWQARVREDPAYGQVICYCKQVTKGEILEAIRRGAVTLDGVKKRTGAGMGRCQSGRCMQTVLELLAEAKEVPADKIMKDGKYSRVLYDDTNETV